MIVLVRHGETAPNRKGLLLGRSDPPLTDRGREQADELARHLAVLEPTAVLSSPLGRAQATAAPIAAVTGCAVDVDDRLVEIDYGEWDGQPLADLTADVVTRWRADADFAPPGGESLRMVGTRVAGLCQERLGREVVVAVSHVSPIKAAVTWALGVGDEVAWRMRLDVASITRIAPGPVLLAFNERLP
ncbi:MAG: histidine phosphatase family protein [Acidimicrobiia bacterium]